ncbi:MAG TPA: NDP-sugar synthase [Vicinamibacteria bacterium]|nr:NDP-sugar synthase [Vicinamibacteria bacterium]
MILAAGLGTRMRPLTLLAAKPVLPVLNRPLLHWTLEALARAGVRDVVVNTHHLAATVRRALGDGAAFGLRIRYAHERRILGTGGGPRAVRRFFDREPFLLVNGDVLFDFDLRAVVERHRAAGVRATLVLRGHPDVESYGGVVTGRDGLIRSIAGLPRPAAGRGALFTGVHVMDPVLLERLPPGPSDSVRDLYAPLLAEGERLLGLRVRSAWYDFGSPSLYLASQIAMMSRGFGGPPRPLLVHPQARVHERSRLRRCIVGRRCVVEEGAEVSDSVLWEGARVGAFARVRHSVLATGARVGAGEAVAGQVLIPARRLRARPRGGRLRDGQYSMELS